MTETDATYYPDHPALIRTGEPMDVRQVRTSRGGHIEPELDHTWSEFDQLRWCAGVTKAETGLSLRVSEWESGTYGIAGHGHGLSSRPFMWAWATITDIGIGAEMYRDHIAPNREDR